MGYRANVFRIQGAVFFFCLHLVTAAVAEECAMKAGRLASVQGEAQFLRKGQTLWHSAAMDETFCAGDMLRIGVGGRAAVVLANETVIRIDQGSTLSFGESIDEGFSLIRLLNGVLHIFSHRPRALKILTPYVNGAVEGTEFLVRVSPDTSEIMVFEGLVVATNSHGKLQVASGQAVVAEKERAPSYLAVVRPRDAVQWTLYYPSIFDATVTGRENRASLRIRQAAKELSSGRVEAARRAIGEVLAQDPTESEALALLAIIEVVQNNKGKALHLAGQGLAANPRSAAAALALSYAQQTNFDISGALATLIKAEELNPDNAEIKARLAELQLSVGDLDNAAATAAKAVRLNPNIGRSQTVLGFACLTRVETDQAQAAFKKAIHLDPALPLARLGLGLAMIREGRLAEGRAEIELAAALDPGNALIRSYLGKAYYEEKRDSQAKRQYDIAKTLDPSDPTPWFYDALRKQSLNRPVEALQDLQKSIELNDNRAVYRSRLLLDEDLAVRSASLGRIYDNLGFQQLALVEGWKSIQSDPTNYSAHRFLADSYSVLPRHEIARVSELLRSQLLQPLSIAPVQPQAAESELSILEEAGPRDAANSEYSPLFLHDGISLRADSVGGSNETFGDALIHSGLWKNFSYSLGQFYYQTDGFRENNDQQQNIVNASAQMNLLPNTSVLVEIRKRNSESGDLEMLFDPEQFSEDKRQDYQIKTNRFGFHHSFTPASELIGTVVTKDDEETSSDELEGHGLRLVDKAEGLLSELQYIFQTPIIKITSGIGCYNGDWGRQYDFQTDATSAWLNIEEDTKDVSHANAYLYAHLLPFNNVDLNMAVSYDDFDNENIQENQFNPKLGFTWNPLPSTTLRAAAFRVMSRTLIADQTIEPTELSGFNQFYDDVAGADSSIYGTAVDQKFGRTIFGGMELTRREQDVPFEDATLTNGAVDSEFLEANWREDSGRAYLYWTPLKTLALSMEYFHELFDRGDTFFGTAEIKELRTERLRFGGRYFHPSGLYAKLQVSYIDQHGDFYDVSTSVSTRDDDHFWIVDAGVGYRLPKRYGFLSIEARNLFDECFKFQDTDPANPTISPNQLILLKLTIVL